MPPLSQLFASCNSLSRASFPSSGGMEPVSRLSPRRSDTSPSSAPSAGGSRPLSPRPVKSSPTTRMPPGASPTATPCHAAMGLARFQSSVAFPARASRAASRVSQSASRPLLSCGDGRQYRSWSRSWSAVSCSAGGTVPEKSLPARRSSDRLVRFASSNGTSPLSRLPRNHSSSRFSSAPSCGGTGPLKALSSSASTRKLLSRPNSDGMGPVRVLLLSFSSSNLSSRLNSGGTTPRNPRFGRFSATTRGGAPPTFTPRQSRRGLEGFQLPRALEPPSRAFRASSSGRSLREDPGSNGPCRKDRGPTVSRQEAHPPPCRSAARPSGV